MLKETIQNELTTAIKGKDIQKANVLRGIKSAFTEYEKSPNVKGVPSDSDYVKILQKMAKQRKETRDLYLEKGRKDLAESEDFELGIISEYLPKMLGEKEVEEIALKYISELNAVSMKDMGRIVKAVNAAYPNQIDGAMLAKIIKANI
jgi:uncharacterized protein YqeY